MAVAMEEITTRTSMTSLRRIGARMSNPQETLSLSRVSEYQIDVRLCLTGELAIIFFSYTCGSPVKPVSARSSRHHFARVDISVEDAFFVQGPSRYDLARRVCGAGYLRIRANGIPRQTLLTCTNQSKFEIALPGPRASQESTSKEGQLAISTIICAPPRAATLEDSGNQKS